MENTELVEKTQRYLKLREEMNVLKLDIDNIKIQLSEYVATKDERGRGKDWLRKAQMALSIKKRQFTTMHTEYDMLVSEIKAERMARQQPVDRLLLDAAKTKLYELMGPDDFQVWLEAAVTDAREKAAAKTAGAEEQKDE